MYIVISVLPKDYCTNKTLKTSVSPQLSVCDVHRCNSLDAASILPGPPQATAGLAHSLVGADLVEWRARRREAAGIVTGPAGRLQALEVAEQPFVGPSLNLAVGQEADGLLHTVGVTVAGRGQAGGQTDVLLLLLLLLPTPQIGHSHLQDVCLFLLGVRLLSQELWTQQGLQLLDAGVDAISAQLLHHWLSQLRRGRQKTFSLLGYCKPLHNI